jgi:ABC-type bacteriocin/lantibiotic exporter with double-glycine peptidase domain
MVARAGGANIDPGSLANYMNDPAHYGYHGVAVKWAAIDTFAGEHGYRFDTLVGEGLRLDSTKKSVDLPNSIALSNSVMDQYLRDGALIIAEVYNSGDTHWVVVTGRQDITYSILDPACYKKIERTTLSDYENTVYRIVIYTKQ